MCYISEPLFSCMNLSVWPIELSILGDEPMSSFVKCRFGVMIFSCLLFADIINCWYLCVSCVFIANCRWQRKNTEIKVISYHIYIHIFINIFDVGLEMFSILASKQQQNQKNCIIQTVRWHFFLSENVNLASMELKKKLSMTIGTDGNESMPQTEKSMNPANSMTNCIWMGRAPRRKR